MAKEYKLNIFDVLNAIDQRDGDFYSRLPDDKKAAFLPRVVILWASNVVGRNAEHYLQAVNEFANVNFDDLRDHPELQYRLLSLAGVGSRQDHKYVAPPKGGGGKLGDIEEFLWDYYPLSNSKEIAMIIKSFSRDSFIEFVDQSGCTPEKRKELVGVWDKNEKAKGA